MKYIKSLFKKLSRTLQEPAIEETDEYTLSFEWAERPYVSM